MVQHKRKPKVRKVRAAKKKAKKVLRTLKRVSAPKSRAVKKRLRARLPARAHKAAAPKAALAVKRSEEHTSELQSLAYLVCRLLLEKKKKKRGNYSTSLITYAHAKHSTSTSYDA